MNTTEPGKLEAELAAFAVSLTFDDLSERAVIAAKMAITYPSLCRGLIVLKIPFLYHQGMHFAVNYHY